MPLLDVKPLYVDDAYGHVDESGRSLDAARYYSILRSGSRSVRARRRPYVGILGADAHLLKAVRMLLEDLGVCSINLGTVLEPSDVEGALRLSDMLMLVGVGGAGKGSPSPLVGSWGVKLDRMGRVLCVSSPPSPLAAFVAALYAVRPLYALAFGLPVRQYLTMRPEALPSLSEGVYPASLAGGRVEVRGHDVDLGDVDAFVVSVGEEVFVEALDCRAAVELISAGG